MRWKTCLKQASMKSEPRSQPRDSAYNDGRFQGLGVSPGVAVGPAVMYVSEELVAESTHLDGSEVEKEAAAFEWTVRRAERDLHKILVLARQRRGEDAVGILEAQLMMLRDGALHTEVLDGIRRDKLNAEAVLDTVIRRHRDRMLRCDKANFPERVINLQDILDRLLLHLRGGRYCGTIDPGAVVIARVLTAADLLLFSRSGVVGCSFEVGGVTCHLAIIARALGIPAVLCTSSFPAAVSSGETVIVDALKGIMIVDPSENAVQTHERQRQQFTRSEQVDKAHTRLPATTVDGVHVRLRANVDMPNEVAEVAAGGAQDIGMLRTGMLLLAGDEPPFSEEIQCGQYRRVVEQIRPEITTFRLLDLGGDKALSDALPARSPLRGSRGIRVLLSSPRFLILQVRALLRAGSDGLVRLLLPMVTTVAELHKVKRVIEKTAQNLLQEGIPHNADIPVRVMIKVLAAAFSAHALVQHAAFLVIGTNDLTQYMLAVDRAGGAGRLNSEVHPAVLQLVKTTVEAANHTKIPVSVCGELQPRRRYPSSWDSDCVN